MSCFHGNVCLHYRGCKTTKLVRWFEDFLFGGINEGDYIPDGTKPLLLSTHSMDSIDKNMKNTLAG